MDNLTTMLPFVPRKVAKSLRSTPNEAQSPLLNTTGSSHLQSTLASPQPVPVPASTTTFTGELKGKAKEQPTTSLPETDLAALLTLALTSYALWSNPDLRLQFETSDEGYVPLSYVFSTSKYFNSLAAPPTEAVLVKALRAHAADLVEVRVRMTAPSRAEWYGRYVALRDVGGYEIRLKDREHILARAREETKQSWDGKTLYMENIPPQYRTLAGIYRFVTSLLPGANGYIQTSRVQNVTLPRHYLDKPTDSPKCKGFALVTFCNAQDVVCLSKDWPWRRDHARMGHQDAPSANSTSLEQQEALKFVFRVSEKARWEALNEEYLAYRQRLLDEIARAQEAEASLHNPEPIAAPKSHTETVAPIPPTSAKDVYPSQIQDQRENRLDLFAPFPPGCLVFVRHVHPETNKTTLRKLFSCAFQARDASSACDAIDYVDFNKGMDTCYLRLASPHHTQILCSSFASSVVAQMQGMDDTGSIPSAGSKAITVEIVSGEREELYWGKVPEKVRRQAVEKVIETMEPQTADESKQETGEEEKKDGRKRKRRRG